MISHLTPLEWRRLRGCTKEFVAARTPIAGKNPSRTYDRYERGENPCPADVIEAVRQLSGGAVGAEGWQKVRLDYLRKIGRMVTEPTSHPHAPLVTQT